MIRTGLIAAFALSLCAAPFAYAQTAPTPDLDPAKAPAGAYVLDPGHASVVARVVHMGLSHYALSFNKVDAKYDYDPAKPQASKISVTIDANSLDTGIKDHAAQFAKQFLGADKNPTITFVSTAIAPGADAKGTVTGDLTLNGVTRPVTLDVTYRGASGFMGGHRMGFSARTTIKRSDFGSKALLGVASDEVEIHIEAEFKKA